MSNAGTAASGKGSGDENFPVASHLVAARHRAPIMAYYRFARAADDVADHPTLPPAEKLALLDRLEATLTGHSDDEPDALPLRAALAERGMGPRHALDLLVAFRLDVTKARYADWDDLMDYCSYSAAPVGRFVLDVHGEDDRVWPASDAICSALQVVNHLQDCAKDYRALDRVYIPLDAFSRHGCGPEALGAGRASPGLRACVSELARRTGRLLDAGDPFVAQVADLRLGLEIGVIQGIARRLVALLEARDPLSEKVHLGKPAMLGVALASAVGGLIGRARRRPVAHAPLGTRP